MEKGDIRSLNVLKDGIEYFEDSNIAIPKGASNAKILKGKKTNSAINKLHLIKLAGDYPSMEKDIPKHGQGFFSPKTVVDLCRLDGCANQYDIEDFLYCKNLGGPINKLVTLRRFPYPCTDNIYDKEAQNEPDIARMVAYTTQDINKLDDLLSFSYALRWKELTAEMEQASMFGDQSGLSGFMKKLGNIMDPTLNENNVSGRTNGPMSQYEPKTDQNKVYGPVDSISSTNIRDVGIEFNKEFELTFDYEMRSIGGRTPEYAFKDLIANILACTYVNAKFWPGSRYWVGERPTNFRNKIAWMNSDNVDEVMMKASESLKSGMKEWFGDKQSTLNTLKSIVKGGIGLALGKILDSVGRPGILAMNSLLCGEPTGNWMVTVGNPINPIMNIGNLILTGVDFKFPTDSLSYGDFPTKMQVIVKLKPGQPKDKAGIEIMFNHGAQRIYYAPKTVSKIESKNNISRQARSFFNFGDETIDRMLSESYDFVAEGVKVVTKTVVDTHDNLVKSGIIKPILPNKNAKKMAKNKLPIPGVT